MDPPLFDGGVNATDIWVFAGVALRPVGASGGPNGVAATFAEAVPEPIELTARSPIE